MTTLEGPLDEITASTRRFLRSWPALQYSNSSSWVPVRSKCTVLGVAE